MTGTGHDVAFKLYPYLPRALPDDPEAHPVVIVGAGPVGLALALDLGRKGTPVLLVDEGEGAGQGSRAICFAKRTLEISDRLGAVSPMVDKGVVWNVGRVFHGADTVFEFNLQPEPGHKLPAFINLQQPYFEKFLVDETRKAQAAGAPIEIRGKHRVTRISAQSDHARLEVETPDGPYQIVADWVIACDGARSPLRKMMGLGFEGRVFEDNFLIADVKMKADFPTERWFWFNPPFEKAGASALLHKQPDDIWRLDFQLGWNIDRAAELQEDRIRARVDSMLGPDTPYDLEWTSIYTFQCRRMQKFRHGRVLFAGDSAHQVSPFGARGANSGVQDADNLAWKLDLVVKGYAPEGLLDSYCAERVQAADENILNSTRATDFLTPKSEISKVFRNAVLTLAGKYAFARTLVNSGRLSVPCRYEGSMLNGPDTLKGPTVTSVGGACVDAPLAHGFLLNMLGGDFTLLAINCAVPDFHVMDGIKLRLLELSTAADDPTGALSERYLGTAEQAMYLIRPDQHIAARWRAPDASEIASALQQAMGVGA